MHSTNSKKNASSIELGLSLGSGLGLGSGSGVEGVRLVIGLCED